MKIATFNINNINKRLPNLLAWLKAAKPDVICLQELKAQTSEFPEEALRKAGYFAVWAGQKSWNGVAILARKRKPVLVRERLPGDETDREARYIEAAVNGILIACIYAPNGNPQPGPKFKYKLAWMKRLNRHAATLLKADVPVALIGDFNVAPTALDIYVTRSWNDDALVQPASRKAFDTLLQQGWCDAIRTLHPDERLYSFWTYWRGRFERDDGLRLDHVLLSPHLAARLKRGGIDRAVRGKENASDHAPVWVELKKGKG
jgi:exodeoxyribonuclease III